MTRLMVSMLGAAVAALSAAPATAAEQCAPRADMIKALGEKFRENPTALGVVNPNVIVEVFVSDQGTWTILASDTGGQSCVVSVGEGWESAVKTAALPGT